MSPSFLKVGEFLQFCAQMFLQSQILDQSRRQHLLLNSKVKSGVTRVSINSVNTMVWPEPSGVLLTRHYVHHTMSILHKEMVTPYLKLVDTSIVLTPNPLEWGCHALELPLHHFFHTQFATHVS